MADANTAAFLDGGSAPFANPFQNAPSASSSDPNDQPNPANPGGISNNEMWHRADAQKSMDLNSAAINAPGLQQRATPQTATSGYENQYAAERAGMTLEDYHAMRAREREHSQGRSVMRNILNDPVTFGVLSAPYAVVGGGAAVGGPAALGFGEAAAAGGAAAAPAVASVGPAAAPVVAGSSATTIPLATGAAAAPVVAGGSAAAAPTAAGGFTAGNVIDAAGLVGTLGIAALDQRKTDAEKKLLAKQEQMAAEAQKRQQQMQTAGMNALGQRLLAFNPENQMMAKMYGPEAAFAPEQFAQMAENPMGPPRPDADLVNAQNYNPDMERRLKEYQAQKAEYEQQEAKRKSMLMNGITPVGQGPTPIQQRAPQAARRF